MSNRLVKVGGFEVSAGSCDEKFLVPIGSSLDNFYELTERFEAIKREYEDNRFKLEQMCSQAYEEIGFKSLKNDYIQITFIPASPGKEKTETKLSETKVRAFLEDLGYEPEEVEEKLGELSVTETKTTGARKCSLRITKE